MMNRWTNRVVLLLVLIALVAGPALAHEQKAPIAVVEELEQTIEDADATWDDKWKAYTAAKDAIAAEKVLLADRDPPVTGPAELRYAEIRGDVADALRRDSLPASGWIMGFFAASLLWGGFAVCIAIARKSGKRVDPDGA